MIKDKRLLVTGGTGSFGTLFVKELLKLKPAEVIVFSRDEDKQGKMRLEYQNNKTVRFMLGDIKDYNSVREAIRGVDYIIHAAALKWIPEVERNVWEGVKTNVIGMQNIIEAARQEGVEKVVALSTDKALEPINAYGMTKALQERLVSTAGLYSNGAKTIFVSTRYGNVLGSRGSVVPLFRKLIDEGRPLTVTDPEMTRFLLTLDDSVKLVLKALKEGVGGEVFTVAMPAHTIADLAEVMLESVPKSKRRIKIIGIRPGEKIHESLVGAFEANRTVKLGKYFAVLPQIPVEAVEKKYKHKKRLGDYKLTSDKTRRLNKKELKKILKKEGWL